MITISLCMIVKNEALTLARCLDTVKDVVDEIVIVDTGSDDGTKDIAAVYTDKVFDFAWCDDFSAARNFSYQQATMDYILWLDADDILLPDDAVKLSKLKTTMPPDIDVAMMRYNTGFDAQGKVIFSCFRERLSRNDHRFTWKEPVHEYLDAGWKRVVSDVCITHAKPPGRQSDRNISIYENCLAKGETLSVRGTYYYARELKDHARYADAIHYFCMFLDSGQGWVEDCIAACDALAVCYLNEKKPEDALRALWRSFNYDTPRAEICCRIGYYFKTKSAYRQAAFWFALVFSLEKNPYAFGFRQEDCWGYIPCLELAVCYDKLGDYEKAARLNELAALYKPDTPAVLHNRQYFADRIKNQS